MVKKKSAPKVKQSLDITDELIAEMLRQRKAAGILNENALNEDAFDEIETEASDEGED